MAYFPFFVDLSSRQGVIVGGGIVALRKIEKLIPFSPSLRVIAPEICPEIRQIPGLELIEREFISGDETNAFFVIAATNNAQCNHKISELCREKHILVNVVDDASNCTFLFPALVQDGDLTVGISTAGCSPTAAICLKEQIRALIPNRFNEILAFLHHQRDNIKLAIPDEKKRHLLLRKLFFAAMRAKQPLNDTEVSEILRKESIL